MLPYSLQELATRWLAYLPEWDSHPFDYTTLPGRTGVMSHEYPANSLPRWIIYFLFPSLEEDARERIERYRFVVLTSYTTYSETAAIRPRYFKPFGFCMIEVNTACQDTVTDDAYPYTATDQYRECLFPVPVE